MTTIVSDTSARERIARIIDPDVMSDERCDQLGIREPHRSIYRDKLLAKADAILASLPSLSGEWEPIASASLDLAYSTGFSDARGLAAVFVWNHKSTFDRKALHDGIRAIAGPSSEAGWDGVEMPFTLALEQIDGEAPADEPRDGPTVGFQPSGDPEQDDGNDVVEQAFREGVARGRWEAAAIARTAMLSATPSSDGERGK